ncbi:hypothetical protein VitviT2T_010307 [Vitis vinifera]|uniref:Copia protein n=1 Tax=Vitis vinifera TaxID=29760 RepID=A0ABY9C7B9_VITVI|nr:hypothetical protein VitviT2T_010307 [Vitis vinifera]
MALGLCETLWLRLLLQDLGYLSRQPIRLFCDNKATCDIAHNPVQHDRTKHVEVDRFFIKEKLDDKIVELPKIRSEDQMIDILAKVVSTKIDYFERLRPEELYQQNIEALVAENNLERIKERSVHSKETPQFMSGAQSLEVMLILLVFLAEQVISMSGFFPLFNLSFLFNIYPLSAFQSFFFFNFL